MIPRRRIDANLQQSRGQGAFFFLLSRKQNIFSVGWRPNTDTEKKLRTHIWPQNGKTLRTHWDATFSVYLRFVLSSPLFYFWLSWEVFIISPGYCSWCLPNFSLQSLTARRINMDSWLPQCTIFIYKSLKSILLIVCLLTDAIWGGTKYDWHKWINCEIFLKGCFWLWILVNTFCSIHNYLCETFDLLQNGIFSYCLTYFCSVLPLELI